MDANMVFGVVSLISLVAALVPWSWLDQRPKPLTAWLVLSVVCFLVSVSIALHDDPGFVVFVVGVALVGVFLLLITKFTKPTTREEREAAYAADTTIVKAVLLEIRHEDGLRAFAKVALGEKAFGWAGAVVAAENLDKIAIFEVTYASGRVAREKVKVGSRRYNALIAL